MLDEDFAFCINAAITKNKPKIPSNNKPFVQHWLSGFILPVCLLFTTCDCMLRAHVTMLQKYTKILLEADYQHMHGTSQMKLFSFWLNLHWQLNTNFHISLDMKGVHSLQKDPAARGSAGCTQL